MREKPDLFGERSTLFAIGAVGVVILSVVAGGVTILPTLASTDDTTERQTAEGEALSGEIDLADADTRLLGEGANDTAGWVVAAAGDVNGDGVDDVLVGAPRNDSAGNDSGAAYVFYGPVEAGDLSLSDADVRLTGSGAGDLAAIDVAAGDLDGDGYSDVVVGAPFNDSAGSDAGAVYVVSGSSELSGTVSLADADVILAGTSQGGQAGRSVATVNGSDGAHDLVVGAPRNDSSGNDSGAAYVLDGSGLASGSLADGATFIGAGAGDLAGWDVSSAGDFDGDGVDDFLVSARGNDSSAPDAGAAYVVSGAARFDGGSLADATVALVGAGQGDNAGYAVSGAGDVNDDGYSDVLVGAPLNDSAGANAGVAYVVYGSDSPPSSVSLADADLTLHGVAAGDRAGWSVSSAGSVDPDCDPSEDVLVGAPYNNSTGPNAGAAYLVFGGQADGNRSLSDADAIFSGESAGDRAGLSVSGAGDASGDGDEDVLVGAPYNNSTGPDAGAAYLLQGQCPEEPTPAKTQTKTPTRTKSPTPTATPTATATPTDTATPKPTPTAKPTPTPTEKPPATTTEPPTTTASPTPTKTPPTTKPDDAVEFINCSAVRIHGDYEGILIGAHYLEIATDANEYFYHTPYTDVVPERAEGTTVIDLTQREGAAVYINYVRLARDNEVLPDSRPEDIDVTASNPHEYGYDSCIDESRDPDDDGYTSMAERSIVGTDPNDPDTDDDGLLDGNELGGNVSGTPQEGKYMTDPHDPDTDGDGYQDGEEVEAGTDPTDPDDYPESETTTTTASPDASVEFVDCRSARVNAPEGYHVRYSGYTFVQTGDGSAHPNWADPISEDEWPGGEETVSTDWFYPDDPERADRAVLTRVVVFNQNYQEVASASNPDAENADDLCGQEAECEAAKQDVEGADPDTCEGDLEGAQATATPTPTTDATPTTTTTEASTTTVTTENETTQAETTQEGTTQDEQ